MKPFAHMVEIAPAKPVEGQVDAIFAPLSIEELEMIGGGGSITNTL